MRRERREKREEIGEKRAESSDQEEERSEKREARSEKREERREKREEREREREDKRREERGIEPALSAGDLVVPSCTGCINICSSQIIPLSKSWHSCHPKRVALEDK